MQIYRSISSVSRMKRLNLRSLSTNSTRTKSKLDYLGVSIFAVISIGTASLGVWQLKRYNWKSDLIQERQTSLRKQPQNYSSSQSTDESSRFENFVLNGTILSKEFVLLGPRSAPKLASKSAMARQGYYILIPFHLEGTKKTVVLNLGWISGRDLDMTQVREKLKKERENNHFEVVLTQFERNGPKHSGKNFLWVDYEGLKNVWGNEDLSELYFEATGSGEFDRKEIDEFINFSVSPSVHLGYSATWFGISLAALGILRSRFFK
eukprot:maker-scaffold_29-snap-gene-2.2-mRNA-1 protein AED:0.00 eAED:0.00 QI:75/1/1/1/1/1/2/259/263